MDAAEKQTVPLPRRYHRATSVDEFLLIYGGCFLRAYTKFKELWIYNTVSAIWKRYPAPTDRSIAFVFYSMCAFEHIVYIFGGCFDSYKVRKTNSLISFNIRDATWQTLSPHTKNSDINIPPPMVESCIFYHNGSLYILGGVCDKSLNSLIYKFCLETSTWSLVPQNGQRPNHFCRRYGTVFKDKFYTFENSDELGSSRFKDINIFDLNSNTWSTRATNSKIELYPDGVRIQESIAFSSRFGYVSGGESANGFYSDIWRIDLETLEWIKLDTTLKPHMSYINTFVVDDSYLYCFGGYSYNSNRFITLERYEIEPPKSEDSFLKSTEKPQNEKD